MARVNSKYFADIIAKFLEAKRKENIIIDESFRDEFRVKLMARAAEISPIASNDLRALDVEVEELPDRAPVDWWGGVRRFRYVLAFVPSALLVVLASNYVMNMPIEMGSEVVVPRVNDESFADDRKPLFISEEGDENLASETMVSEDSQSSSDSTSSDSRDSSSSITPVIDQIQTQDLGQLSTQAQNNDTEYNQLNDPAVLTVSADMFQPIGAPQLVAPSQPAVSSQSVPAVQNEVVEEGQPTVDSGALSVTPNNYIPTSQIYVPQVTSQPVQKVGNQNVPEPEASDVPKVESRVQSLSTPVNEVLPLNNSSVSGSNSVTEVKSAPVYYYTNLSSVEKVNLEEQIEHSVDQTDVKELHVYSLSGDVFEVVIRFNDGSAITRNLRKSGANGSFDDVSSRVAEDRAASESVFIPPGSVQDAELVIPPTYIPPSIPSGYYGPLDYEVLLDYERVGS